MADTSNPGKDTELTMCDVLQEEQELEEDANAVLGGSDDTNCSYDDGYVPRQALYACKTCSVGGDAGVCLACCYACHDGHEVVELYTKRNFRCDCGNSKFNDKTCSLRPDKDAVNSKNKYNQNFKGVYCTCSRPYPDLEDSIPDEMIQCVMCEDWYHGRHLGIKIPEDYFEMICFKCMEAHKFLYSYLNNYNVKVDSEAPTRKATEQGKIYSPTKDSPSASAGYGLVADGGAPQNQTADADAIKSGAVNGCGESAAEPGINDPKVESEPCLKSDSCDGPVASKTISRPSTASKLEGDVLDNGPSPRKKTGHPSSSIKVECNGSTDSKGQICLLKGIDASSDISNGSAFWPETWRSELCRCPNCASMYEMLQCQYLLNPEDTIQAYEERGKGRSKESQYDQGLSALGRLDRVRQMEAVRAYTTMKGQLKEYLKEFADNKRTVCESDIKEFFERIGKKQKLNNGVPHFCR